MADSVVHSGTLLKYKSLLKWSPRNFVLTQDNFYCNEDGSELTVHISNLKLINASGKCFNVEDSSTGTVLYLKASSVPEKIQWINAINSHTGTIVFKGVLQKWTNVIKGWQNRYFILFKDRLCYYLKSEAEGETPLRRGTIILSRQQISVSNSNNANGFDLITDVSTWHLKAGNPELMEEWVKQIKARIPATAIPPPTSPTTQEPGPSPDGADSDQESHYRKDLECSICLDLLREPTTLVCGHSFCRECLAQMWNSQRSDFKCPYCRVVIQSVPAVNIALENVIQSLYDEQATRTRPEDRSSERSAFESHFSGSGGSSSRPGGVRMSSSGRSTTVTANYSFQANGDMIKRAAFFISFCLALRAISSSFTSDDDFNKDPGEREEEEGGSPIIDLLDSRNTAMFLLMSWVECPRVLAIYLFIFSNRTLFSPLLQLIAEQTDQELGMNLYIRVLIWGAVTPHIWAIPLLRILKLYLLLPFALALGVLEVWEGLMTLRDVTTQNREIAPQTFIKTVKTKTVNSAGKLLVIKIVSYLPWHWLPEFVFYLVILFRLTTVAHKAITQGKTLLDRSYSLQNQRPAAAVAVERD